VSASNNHLSVAVVGVTGAVGQEFLAVLDDRDFPIGELRLLASERSAGKSITFKGKTYTVQQLTEESFKGIDLALFSAGGSISKKFAPIAAEAGAVVVDNSSAFRMVDGIPLVVPEVNPEAMKGIRLGKGAIIANPNCSTIIMLVPVTPIMRAVGIKRIVVSTYQAASGAGARAMAELEQQTRDVLAGRPVKCEVFRQQYAFNLFSHNSDIQETGYNLEEMKMVHETHKIWGKQVGITATCVRVPVMRAHAEAINLTLPEPITEEEAFEILRKAPGVSIIDDRKANRFPTPLDATGKDDILVGRIRVDISHPGSCAGDSVCGQGLDMFVCGDQLRKGAALNAVQIAELLL